MRFSLAILDSARQVRLTGFEPIYWTSVLAGGTATSPLDHPAYSDHATRSLHRPRGFAMPVLSPPATAMHCPLCQCQTLPCWRAPDPRCRDPASPASDPTRRRPPPASCSLPVSRHMQVNLTSFSLTPHRLIRLAHATPSQATSFHLTSSFTKVLFLARGSRPAHLDYHGPTAATTSTADGFRRRPHPLPHRPRLHLPGL